MNGLRSVKITVLLRPSHLYSWLLLFLLITVPGSRKKERKERKKKREFYHFLQWFYFFFIIVVWINIAWCNELTFDWLMWCCLSHCGEILSDRRTRSCPQSQRPKVIGVGVMAEWGHGSGTITYWTQCGRPVQPAPTKKKIWTDGILQQNIIYSRGTVLEVTQINDSISMFGRGNSCDLLRSPYHFFFLKRSLLEWLLYLWLSSHMSLCHFVCIMMQLSRSTVHMYTAGFPAKCMFSCICALIKCSAY